MMVHGDLESNNWLASHSKNQFHRDTLLLHYLCSTLSTSIASRDLARQALATSSCFPGFLRWAAAFSGRACRRPLGCLLWASVLSWDWWLLVAASLACTVWPGPVTAGSVSQGTKPPPGLDSTLTHDSFMVSLSQNPAGKLWVTSSSPHPHRLQPIRRTLCRDSGLLPSLPKDTLPLSSLVPMQAQGLRSHQQLRLSLAVCWQHLAPNKSTSGP